MKQYSAFCLTKTQVDELLRNINNIISFVEKEKEDCETRISQLKKKKRRSYEKGTK